MNLVRLWLAAAVFLIPHTAFSQAVSYLPLAPGLKWVLRSPSTGTPAVFEVTAKEGSGFHIKASNPWGSSEFVLEPQGQRFVMTRFGTAQGMMNLADKPVYLDFGQAVSKKWTTSLGDLENTAKNVAVKTARGQYLDTMRFRHSPKGGDPLFYTFAKDVGFVQFGEGGSAFVLDEAASHLPAAGKAGEAQVSPRSAQRTLVGLTPNRFANEPNTPANMIKRFQQTLDTGVQFLVGNSTWAELEPRPRQYNLESLNYLVSTARDEKLPILYTVRAIDTIHKATPDDLKGVRWSDSKMVDRALRMVEAIAPSLRGQVRWFVFGYEIDGYMDQHANEVADYVSLYKKVEARVKELIPGVQVSVTFSYMNLDKLEKRLSLLNPELDFLALTYTPILPGWVVDEPTVLPRDFDRMRKVAGNRKVVFQEIAYPTASINHGSEEKQAKFYQLAFDEWAKEPGRFEAANFMMLADLSDQDTDNYGAYYGMRDSQSFKSLLQTLGMFDTKGQPKTGWEVFRKNVKNGAN